MRHSLSIEGSAKEHWFAVCDWFLSVPEEIRTKFGKPVDICYRNLYENPGSSRFIPITRILAKFVHADYNFKSRELMVIIPRFKHSCF